MNLTHDELNYSPVISSPFALFCHAISYIDRGEASFPKEGALLTLDRDPMLIYL